MGWGEGNNNVIDRYQGPIMERCGGFLYIYIWGGGGVSVCVCYRKHWTARLLKNNQNRYVDAL